MLWNVYVIDESELIKINSEPYDAEQIAMLIEELGSPTVILQATPRPEDTFPRNLP